MQRFSDGMRDMLATRNKPDSWQKPSVKGITLTMREFTKLHIAMQAAAEEIRQSFSDAGLDSMLVQVTVTHSELYNEHEIKYTVAKGKYEGNGVTGNELAPAVTEYLRRNGWDISNNTKLITAVKRATVS